MTWATVASATPLRHGRQTAVLLCCLYNRAQVANGRSWQCTWTSSSSIDTSSDPQPSADFRRKSTVNNTYMSSPPPHHSTPQHPPQSNADVISILRHSHFFHCNINTCETVKKKCAILKIMDSFATNNFWADSEYSKNREADLCATMLDHTEKNHFSSC